MWLFEFLFLTRIIHKLRINDKKWRSYRAKGVVLFKIRGLIQYTLVHSVISSIIQLLLINYVFQAYISIHYCTDLMLLACTFARQAYRVLAVAVAL